MSRNATFTRRLMRSTAKSPSFGNRTWAANAKRSAFQFNSSAFRSPSASAPYRKAGWRALKLTAILAAGVSALAFPQFLPVIDALPAFPQWAIDTHVYGALGAWALQSAAMLVWTTATVVISNGWPLALLLPVFWGVAFVQGMQLLWDSASRNMRLPTIDALALWHSNATRRAEARPRPHATRVDRQQPCYGSKELFRPWRRLAGRRGACMDGVLSSVAFRHDDGRPRPPGSSYKGRPPEIRDSSRQVEDGCGARRSAEDHATGEGYCRVGRPAENRDRRCL